MIKRILTRLAVAGIIASIWAAAPAAAQTQKTTDKQTTTKSEPVTQAGDSVSIADVQRAAEDLAIAVQAAVKKATEDPALKVAALKVATNAVNAAQVVVTQQAATLQAVLDSLAKEIAMATEKQSKQKSH